MRKLITFAISIVFILVTMDIVFGYITNLYIKKYGLRGDYQPIEYVMKQCKEDVLFIGSSVVINSMMPSVFEDSLGVTCYNTGANSQTMPYFHTILNSVLQRYTPQMIVLGLRPDELSGNDIGRYHLLVPYYHTGNSEIDSVLESKNEYEKNLLRSNLYRYNTIWFRILLYHFLRGDESKIMKNKGFSGHEKPLFPPYMTNSEGNQNVSGKKVSIFEDMIHICKNHDVTLVVYSPPMYTRYKEKTGTVKEIERLCKENAVQYYYDTQDSFFLEHQELFYDNIHLNMYGAVEYSKRFVAQLKVSIR